MKSIPHLLLAETFASTDNDVYDNGSANDGCDGIEREKTIVARKGADKVAQQGDGGTAEHGSRK